jgi:hypothetical protein
MYIYKIIQEWKTTIKDGIQLTNNKKLNTRLYADDQVLIAKSEDELQTAANHLNKKLKNIK